MEIVILGASGATGRQLVSQALKRGHNVIAVAREPSRIPEAIGLQRLRADVMQPGALRDVIGEGQLILSTLGVSKGDKAGVLYAGAQAVIDTQPRRIIWLGAIGTGASAQVAGWLTRSLLSLMGDKLNDKVAADTAVLVAGGTVFHAGPLSNEPLSDTRRTVHLIDVPRRIFPASVSRATVAASMLDEFESPRFPGATAVPLER